MAERERFGPPRKPDSALSRHPSPGGSPGLLWEELRLPARTPRGAGTIWLARTGGLPGRPLAGYRRWALTPPFHPSPVLETGPVTRLSSHRLVCSLLHLT